MKTDVKSAIADILKQENVTHVFGHTGGHIRALWKAITDAGITTVFNKQEGNAVYMADAYSKLTNKIPVILGTSGPGVENMVAATSSAYLDSTPLIIIGAMVPTFAVGKNALQDSSGRGRAVEQRLVFKACTKQAMLAPTPEDVPTMIREAFRVALSGRPGPVYVEVPANFWNVEISYDQWNADEYKNLDLPICPKSKVVEINEAFYKAKKPLIIIGEGAIERSGLERKQIISFLKKLKVPFALSPLAKSFVDETNPYCVGVLRGVPVKTMVYEYFAQSDFILSLGARFNQWESGWDYNRLSLFGDAVIAQVDPDPEEIGRVFAAQYSVVGSVSSFINQSKVKQHVQSNNLLDIIEKMKQKYPEQDEIFADTDRINPRNLNSIVRKYASKNAIIVTDTGYAGSMSLTKFATKPNQDFLSSDRNSPMGYGIPAALGAGLVAGEREVICFVGDGGFHMTCNEFGLLMDYASKVIFVLEDNSGCSMITDGNMSEYGKTCMTEFSNPDFVKIAQAYGMKAVSVSTTKDFEREFKKAQKEKVSVLIDAKIDQDSMVWE